MHAWLTAAPPLSRRAAAVQRAAIIAAGAEPEQRSFAVPPRQGGPAPSFPSMSGSSSLLFVAFACVWVVNSCLGCTVALCCPGPILRHSADCAHGRRCGGCRNRTGTPASTPTAACEDSAFAVGEGACLCRWPRRPGLYRRLTKLNCEHVIVFVL